ncbi:histidine kinase [Blastococcus sp. CT_GayMR20]|uniref:sensor histidine kinase n=1 Tax=Blastococcus sp. CT_GayMR20 TaxID=2559609 RepID=UPI001073D487|nr:histidine kinase [Blastococcus sp. CT_GayMR20]TFV80195.1 histidine kinase [Blastococcus sp. CT_GayMR20]
MTSQLVTPPGTVAPEPARRGWVSRAVAWSVVPVYLFGVGSNLVLQRRLGSPGLDPVEGMLLWLGFGMFAAMGALLIGKRPRNAVGWVMAGAAVLLALAPAGDHYAAWVLTTSGRADPLAVLGAWVQGWYWLLMLWLVFAVLPVIFPDGRLPSRRWRLPVGAGAVGAVAIVVSGMLPDTLTGQDVDYRIANPIGIDGLPGAEEQALFPVFSGLSLIGIVTAVAAVVVRFRRSRGAGRQQMKWFLFAIAPVLALPVTESLPGWVGGGLLFWVLLGTPVAVAVAVLRYRLDGIDVVIDRTLVYGTLTVLVVGIYVLVVGYLGVALRREDDLLVSLVATGIVAVLFAPLRDRLQRAVSRLLYGQRAEPYAALSRLGERLESTLAPDAVLPAIVSTVREALRLPYAAIRIEDRIPVYTGDPPARTLDLPLLYQNRPVGELVLGLRPGEEGFAPADRRLLADLARQAGVAVSTVRLTADLQRSRERLVAAREEERRRLRRDLHDGLGAQLAGLTVQTGVLRGLMTRDPEAADALVAELRAELKAAIADIRRLVHGLRPPALDELGLVGALEQLAERIGSEDGGVTVSVEVPDDLPDLPAAVEVAAYRIVSEALTNVVRHAGARAAAVRLTAGTDSLTVEVTDDGAGLPAAPTAGVGLSSMRERAAEMGGSCSVEPGPDGGTRVLARLPFPGGA